MQHIKLTATAVAIALALAACGKQHKTEQTAASAPEKTEFITEVQAPKSDGTVGMLLPDFSQLVAREGAAVVNIQALRGGSENSSNSNNNNSLENDPYYEFFKRLIPNQPDFQQEEDDSANFGSGVIISQDGYILTNAHVVKGLNTIKVTLNDKREYRAKLIGSDDKSDIALLKIESDHLPVAKIGNSGSLKAGEWVAAIGAPFGFDNSVTAGIVSAKNRALPGENYTPFIQTDVAINPGNSGGPLYNLKGEVVGINSQIYSRSGGFMGISFAIPIEVAMNVADQLKATGKVERGQLGVVIQEVNHDLAKSFDLDKPMGALVARVIPNSPAEKAGLQVGDIIRSVNGEEVRSSNDLPMTIGALAPGKEVKLGLWRKGKPLDATVQLGSSSQQNAQKEATPQGSRADNVSGFDAPKAGLTIAVQNTTASSRLTVFNSEGAAARAGIHRGDIILQINGQDVSTQQEFETALEQAGKNIPVLIEREGNVLFLALVLE
ncbi:DegQ family serine endoprotease [Neisseriaceae bacterium B1]